MEGKAFRVLLDFSEVNTGISGLKYVWMHVSPRELNTIYDFKQAIVRKFSFNQEGFKLYVRDGLLLETEKIAILREDDIVKVLFETSQETSMSFSAISSGVNIAEARASCHSVIGNAVGVSKSCKRKSETFMAASNEIENDSVSISRSKKKKKQDKTSTCASDESVNFSRIDEPSNNFSQDLLGSDKNSTPNASSNKEKNKQPFKNKKKNYSKTPTSEFINLAMKLTAAEGKNQNFKQVDVNAANNTRIIDDVTDSNLYKTAEIVSKTNLSPIPEQSTYRLSNSETPFDVTESCDVGDSQIEDRSSLIDGEADGKISRKRKRRRRKRKVISTTQDPGLILELEGSFLTDDKSNETYNATSDTRKHIIFHSPSPPEGATTVTLDVSPESGFDVEPPLKNNGSKSNMELDISLNECSQIGAKVSKDSVFSVTEDFKESTPFPRKKSKEKLWGVTPLPRIGSSSHTFSVENSDVSRTDVTKSSYQNYAPLNCLPPVGTRLAFKTLELNEEYCPEVTEYKEGVIRKVNPNTDELEIELIQEEVKPGRSGKFENVWKDEPIPDDQVIKTVSLNWSALIEPRLVPQ